MSLKPEVQADLAKLKLDPVAPLLIVDVDEVLAQFMRGFESFVFRHGYEMRIDKFALFQNVYEPGKTTPITMEVGKPLFDAFFEHGIDDLLPSEGAAAALASLSNRVSIVILSNAPAHGRQTRSTWLKRHGLDYPLILNREAKGPAVRQLASMTSGQKAFIDDLLPNLDSVADHAPDVTTFQMIADPRLRPFAPVRPDRHVRHDDWLDLGPALDAVLR
jgi:hypothetical protein